MARGSPTEERVVDHRLGLTLNASPTGANGAGEAPPIPTAPAITAAGIAAQPHGLTLSARTTPARVRAAAGAGPPCQ